MKVSIYLLFALLISCQLKNDPSETKSFNPIRIQTYPTQDPRVFDEILDSVIIIPLEFTENSAIRRIHKVRMTHDRIFILDELDEKLYVFSFSGKYLQAFELYGKGPGEVISISDIEVDLKRKLLLILSGSSKSIHRYRLNDLSFVDQIDLPFFPSSFAINKSMDHLGFQVGYYHPSNKNFHITDMEGNLVYSGFKFPNSTTAHNLSHLTGGIHTGLNDHFLYSDALSNEIDEVSIQGSINRQFKFSFDSNWPKSDQYNFDKFNHDLGSGTLNFMAGKFIESPDYLMFSYNLALAGKVKNYAPRKGYFNLTSHEFVTQEYFLQTDLIVGLSGPLGTYKDFFITALYPSRLSLKTDVVGKLGSYGIKYTGENDNPLLFIHRVDF